MTEIKAPLPQDVDERIAILVAAVSVDWHGAVELGNEIRTALAAKDAEIAALRNEQKVIVSAMLELHKRATLFEMAAKDGPTETQRNKLVDALCAAHNVLIDPSKPTPMEALAQPAHEVKNEAK